MPATFELSNGSHPGLKNGMNLENAPKMVSDFAFASAYNSVFAERCRSGFMLAILVNIWDICGERVP